MKRMAWIAIILALIFGGLTCCASREAAVPDDASLLLGFSQLGSESAWRIANTKDMQAAAERYGIDLMYENANQSQEKQIDAIRSFIAYQVDMIAFSPIVEEGWDNVLNEAKSAGIPVILVDRLIDTQDKTLYAGYVGANFYQEGVNCAKYLRRKAQELNAERLCIVEITGTIDSTPMRQRYAGFRDALAGDERFQFLESISGDFLVSKGEECMEYLLQTYGDRIDVLYSHNDEMTIGAMKTIEAAGLTPGKDIIILTIDGGQTAFDLLKEGKINCIAECTPMLGDTVMELMLKLKDGGDIPRVMYPAELTFTEYDDLDAVPPRGY